MQITKKSVNWITIALIAIAIVLGVLAFVKPKFNLFAKPDQIEEAFLSGEKVVILSRDIVDRLFESPHRFSNIYVVTYERETQPDLEPLERLRGAVPGVAEIIEVLEGKTTELRQEVINSRLKPKIADVEAALIERDSAFKDITAIVSFYDR